MKQTVNEDTSVAEHRGCHHHFIFFAFSICKNEAITAREVLWQHRRTCGPPAISLYLNKLSIGFRELLSLLGWRRPLILIYGSQSWCHARSVALYQRGQSQPETSGGDGEAQNAQHQIISIPHSGIRLNCEPIIKRYLNVQMPWASGLAFFHFFKIRAIFGTTNLRGTVVDQCEWKIDIFSSTAPFN